MATEGEGRYCLCVIPARGGSKSLPGKNLARLGGESLVHRAVRAARDSERCSRIVCSTDSDAIAAEAIGAGADAPFRRPAQLATDVSPTIDAVIHATGWVETERGRPVDLICILQPTSPLRTAEDLRAAIDLLLDSRPPVDSVVSVCEVADAHPAWLRKIEGGLLTPYFPDLKEPTRRQDLDSHPAPYRRNGAIYVTRRDVVMIDRTVYGSRCLPYVMPDERSIDIDTETDLAVARALWDHLMT